DKAEADYSSAIAYAIADDPANSHVPYARRAFVRCRQGQFEQALADFHTSYESSPRTTLSLIQFGFRGTIPTNAPFDPALHISILRLFDRYIQDQRGEREARHYVANSLAELKQFDEARQHLQVAES